MDKETIDWEKIDGIDLDMVLLAHKQITQEVEEQLNENGDGSTTGAPSSDDINNINNQNISGNGTTYIENTSGINATEVQAALGRIEVIKTEYGIICNQDTGAGCNDGAGEYNDDPLKIGEAITNPGLLEK